MPKVIIDPVKQAEQFKKDLDAMNVGKDPAAKVVQLRMLPKNFKLDVTGFAFNQWSGKLEEDQSLDDAMEPPFWAGQADQVMGAATKGIGDIIVVRKLSESLYAKLLIVEIGKGFIRTIKVEEARLAVPDVPEGVGLTTRWNVGKTCHEVIRKHDKQMMATGFQTKANAIAWITDHMKALAA
jgi:hypothetical protein